VTLYRVIIWTFKDCVLLRSYFSVHTFLLYPCSIIVLGVLFSGRLMHELQNLV